MPIFLLDWSFVFNSPNDNGMTIFISGFLFTLSFYHFLLFFQHRDRVYLYYSLYTFLTFFYLFPRAEHFILAEKAHQHKELFSFLNIPIQWSFHTLYLFYLKTFINLKKEKPNWDRFLNIVILSFYTILLVLMITSDMNKDMIMDRWFLFFFSPTITLIGVALLAVIYTLKTPLKYYVLIGGSSYLALSLTAFLFDIYVERATSIFYMALFIENTFFALGLGAKQKKILTDKNLAQRAVIKEHEINIQLQNRIKTRLNQEVEEKSREIIELTKKHEQEKRRKLAIEYSKNTLDLRMKALQTQMNPHFLFNSLNSVKHFIIKNNPEDAVSFLSKLAKLIRKILDNSQKQYTSLEEELQVLGLYLKVENIRLNKSILYEQEISPNIDTTNIKIPPLVLQPFIENSIWHGLALIKGEKKIKIKVEQSDSHLVICIKDNGIGREKAAELKANKVIEKESLGIQLTKQRLDSFTSHLKGSVSIRFKDLKNGQDSIGTKVIIEIPIR